MKSEMTPPKHLSASSRRWFREVVATFELDSHHVVVLGLACQALDRAAMAQEAIENAGSLTYTDRFGAPRLLPQVAAKRDAELSFARLLRELGLDLAPDAPRPPPNRNTRR
jgi:phage terminase small subunit